MPNRVSALTPQYAYNEGARRYTDIATGRFVTRQAVRSALDGFVDAASVRMQAHSAALIASRTSLAEWQQQMAREVKLTHLASTAAANGGWAQLSQADYGRIGARVKAQYAFLNNFAQEIASGKQRVDGSLAVRSALYGQAGRQTYEEERRRLEGMAGQSEERRILGPADHCSGCLAAAAAGWQPIGTLPRIGDTPCRTNCRCHFVFL